MFYRKSKNKMCAGRKWLNSGVSEGSGVSWGLVIRSSPGKCQGIYGLSGALPRCGLEIVVFKYVVDDSDSLAL